MMWPPWCQHQTLVHRSSSFAVSSTRNGPSAEKTHIHSWTHGQIVIEPAFLPRTRARWNELLVADWHRKLSKSHYTAQRDLATTKKLQKEVVLVHGKIIKLSHKTHFHRGDRWNACCFWRCHWMQRVVLTISNSLCCCGIIASCWLYFIHWIIHDCGNKTIISQATQNKSHTLTEPI